MTLHFATSFKYEQVYPICFLSGFPKRLCQVTVTYWVYLECFFSWGSIFLMALTVMTQSLEKSLFLFFFTLLGKVSSFRFVGTPINYAWMDSSTMTVSSPNTHFCCLWKKGTLITVAFLKISLLAPSK